MNKIVMTTIFAGYCAVVIGINSFIAPLITFYSFEPYKNQILICIYLVPLVYIIPRIMSNFIYITTNSERDISYTKIRESAKKDITIFGAGMTNLVNNSIDSLREQGRNVNINLYMINPRRMIIDAAFNKLVSDFFNKSNFKQEIIDSYNDLVHLCGQINQANEINEKPQRTRLYTYDFMPTNGMVLIDKDEGSSRMLVEFYLYKKQDKPRVEVRRNKFRHSLYTAMIDTYQKIVGDAVESDYQQIP